MLSKMEDRFTAGEKNYLEHTEIGINSSFAYRSEEEYFLENCRESLEPAIPLIKLSLKIK